MINDKFIILTAGRSGSTYLQQLLNSHPGVKCYDEVFNVTNKGSDGFYSFCQTRYPKISYFFLRGEISALPWNFPLAYLFQQYLKFIYQNNQADKIGFKLIYHQLLHYHSVTSWIAKSSIPIIHLERKNELKAAVSIIKARNTGNYTSTSTHPASRQKVSINPDVILKTLQVAKEEKSTCDSVIKNNPSITIFYEDLFERQSATIQQLADFLQIENSSFQKPDITKTNPEKISEILQNYEEVKQAFIGTLWEKYLD